MKQIFILSLFITTFIVLSGCSHQAPKNNAVEAVTPIEQSKTEITKTYYENFRNTCGESGCCLSSVDNAELVNSLIYEVDSLSNVDCPDGFIPNMNKCMNSYKWCIPKN